MLNKNNLHNKNDKQMDIKIHNIIMSAKFVRIITFYIE